MSVNNKKFFLLVAGRSIKLKLFLNLVLVKMETICRIETADISNIKYFKIWPKVQGFV